MKLRRYLAKDMRQALRQVREEQGPDAVILSSRKTPEGVEVVSAIDFDADAPVETSVVQQRAPAAPAAPIAATANAFDFAGAMDQASRVTASESSGVGEELKTLRRMLETQVATLAWNDLTRRAPVQTELLKDLTQLGLSQDLAAELVSQLPARYELAEAQRMSLALLSRRIAVLDERWLERGGRVAFVGPTGVGKTTMLAKLAARWVLRHGPRGLALISTDSVRIGAQDQIQTLGRLLGTPAIALDSTANLSEALTHLHDRKLILIDTAGLGQRDVRLSAELSHLAAIPDLESTLVLAASAQAGALEETVTRFAVAQPRSCLLTKLDEAASLGGSVSTLIRAQLPLAYTSEGQRIPEDLHVARAHQLIARAVELARRSGASADEDLLRRRFGGVAHALA
jgi:flagellar biosynthesis protein FlhF